jgi:hypothetical protein
LGKWNEERGGGRREEKRGGGSREEGGRRGEKGGRRKERTYIGIKSTSQGDSLFLPPGKINSLFTNFGVISGG